MHRFNTEKPPMIVVEFRSGDITINTEDVDETLVELSGRPNDSAAEELIAATLVEQRGNTIYVKVPKRPRGLFGTTPALHLSITAPNSSNLAIRSASADVNVRGSLGTSKIDTGSGDVTVGHLDGAGRIRTGSGDVSADTIEAAYEIQTGSGDIEIGQATDQLRVQTGSGEVRVDSAGASAKLQTGSGGVAVGQAEEDVFAQTGSGDIRLSSVRRGRVKVQAASGDIHVGVLNGTAAWLDVKTLTGRVASDLEQSGAPAEDDQQVRLQLNTVSGDIAIVRA
ncbi:MAG: DUF4097 family beta strand repeat protein [Propionibacteriales bacterium]|nr:DUF4097 family beta strand repeat protein [Propionibacteriales bacterium]